MLYEIVNPSDAYTIDCPDLEVAAVACCLLGGGQYAFEPIDGNTLPPVPIFLFGGSKEFFHEQFGADFESVMASVQASRALELALALDSTLIGSLSDRKAFLGIAPRPDDVRYETARHKWHDAKRSSMNDIGARAYKMAARLRSGVEHAGLAVPQQVFRG